MTEQTVYRNVYVSDAADYTGHACACREHADLEVKHTREPGDFVYRLNITPKGKE